MTRALAITGAAGGIGAAIARRAAAAGYAPLVLMDRDEAALASVAEETGGIRLSWWISPTPRRSPRRSTECPPRGALRSMASFWLRASWTTASLPISRPTGGRRSCAST